MADDISARRLAPDHRAIADVLRSTGVKEHAVEQIMLEVQAMGITFDQFIEAAEIALQRAAHRPLIRCVP